nr:late embryogenesis abundant protein LEA49 [Pinus tabuliformis]
MSAKGCVTHKDCGRHGHWWEEMPYRRFLQALLALLFIVLFVILVIFLALHPHKPRFYLQNATVSVLNVSDGLLTSSLQFTVVSRNPNDRIGVIYDSLSTYASYLDQQITAEFSLPPFYQDPKDINVLAPILYGNSVPLAPVVCEQLSYESLKGSLSLSLRMNGRVRWKVGSWRSGHYHLYVNCEAIVWLSNNGIGGQVPLQPITTCHVEV